MGRGRTLTHLMRSLCRAAFVFDEGNNLGVSGKGQDFATFKAFFNPDNRGFGYIKVQVRSTLIFTPIL